jgi:hypothetical protein
VFRGSEIDDELEFPRLLDGHAGGLGTFQVYQRNSRTAATAPR